MKRTRKSKKRLLSSNRVSKGINLSKHSSTKVPTGTKDISINAEVNDSDISLQPLVTAIPANTRDINDNTRISTLINAPINDDIKLPTFENIEINDTNTGISADVQITNNSNAEISENIDVSTTNAEISENIDVPMSNAEISKNIDVPTNNAEISENIDVPTSNAEISKNIGVPTSNAEISKNIEVPTDTPKNNSDNGMITPLPMSSPIPTDTQIQVDIKNSISLASPVLSQIPGTQIGFVSAITPSILSSIISNTYIISSTASPQTGITTSTVNMPLLRLQSIHPTNRNGLPTETNGYISPLDARSPYCIPTISGIVITIIITITILFIIIKKTIFIETDVKFQRTHAATCVVVVENDIDHNIIRNHDKEISVLSQST
ncbi:7847_t:CDS:1 [Cetraspora pellucida]|uniref:7847_t:CDS:1 n=1 Tax=Cetraspora pellucida TaxID=1433469 RepID=A0A9N9AFC8_9GLOM|nr:7847_t:CDS:1 [Cetraspora pellucida]